MTKNPDRRLGSLNDADEVMEQSFFADINWTDLQKKRITPPFKPAVNGLMDTKVTSMLQAGLYNVIRWFQIPRKNPNV